ncbi:amidohydrolase family protein [Salipiger sp. P9]|uniref:amidohydrolase family protein n=1 Tax=Salipiger pentaromativorans TaxID=2943193 RepID=UPI0021586A86|nr:amidohydrolase family protein [Salipiger pentaromativorans]MCR8546897.1 amidohydrolase family protein [Salipiger pentaromativorans]
MAPDLIIRNARLPDGQDPVDIAVAEGRIAGIGPGLAPGFAGPCHDAAGHLATAGLIETHIHLDKAGILHRCTLCDGTLGEAVRETAQAKAAFTEEDVYRRAESVVRRAISHGTTRLRSFVEIDPRAGFRSFDALLALRRAYAELIDIELCAFAQEGLTNEPETHVMLDRALARGADLVGGCPYTDPDPARHVAQIFDLAAKYDVAVDFHIDFDLDPARSDLPHVIRETEARGWGGRVSLGHVTKLSALPPQARARSARALADAGIALTVLPATDLFLLGREAECLTPRGMVAAHRLECEGLLVTLSTNNVMNPFTPFGDVSLMRMANLYANIAQAGTPEALRRVFAMVTDNAARLLGDGAYGLRPGAPADIVLFEAREAGEAVATVAPALAGFKRGRASFLRPQAQVFGPEPGLPIAAPGG